MPAELLSLKEQLANLLVVYESTLVSSNATHSDIKRLREQILQLQEKILEREEMLSKK